MNIKLIAALVALVTLAFALPARGAALVSLLSDTVPGLASGGGTLFTPLEDRVVFVAQSDGVSQLWSTDGATAARLEDDIPEPSWRVPFPIARLGPDLAVFWAWGHDGAPSLWRTDGTRSGTSLIAPMQPPASAVDVSAAVDGVIYFAGASVETPNDVELWRTDGTAGGTYRIRDIADGSSGSFPVAFAVSGTTAFFSANDGIHGRELWRTDGTADSTVMVADVRAGKPSGFGGEILPLGDQLLFSAVPVAQSGGALWSTDGSEAGTVQVFATDTEWGPADLTRIGDEVFFRASTPATGYELWKTDGTTAGTTLVKDIAPGATSGLNPSDGDAGLVDLAGTAYFVADDGIHGRELWRSDGTDSGTYIVKDVNPGSGAGVLPQESNHGDTAMVVANGRLYFAGDDAVHGFELWSTDGTEAGTQIVADINPDSAGAYPYNITPFGNTLFFVADDGTHGFELWKLELPDAPGATPTATPTATPAPTATPGPVTCTGDVSGDGVVDATDLQLVAMHYGYAPGPPYDAHYDINGGGWVNSIDLMLVARRYGPCPD